MHTVQPTISDYQFLFRLVNILLQKYDTSSKLKQKLLKHRFYDEKQQKSSKKVYENIN